MILCVDIGNTNIVSAVWDGKKFIDYKRIETNNSNIIEINSKINKVAISSVVPHFTKLYIEEYINRYNINPIVIDHLNCGIKLDVDNPIEVGPDRICNVFAAKNLKKGPTIVVDFGSATTYDIINENGHFIGGAIAPGIDVSANNLIQKAALLKEVAFTFPNCVIGKNTITNLQSGIMFSGLDAVEGMLRRISNELAQEPNIYLTGGFSTIISDRLQIPHTLLPMLTLDGVRLIAEKIQ